MTEAPLAPGGLNWERRWRTLVEDRRHAIEALDGQGPQAGYWDRRAGWFARLNRGVDPATDRLVRLVADALGDAGDLLDVGAGSGRYALPLARVASRVTAVEPSAGMRAHMEEEARDGGLQNLTFVASTWEDALVEAHDVVLCAHVLYPIADVVPFIRKLDAHARRACFITARADQMVPSLAPLWPEVWGIVRPPEPTLPDLYNLLYQLGLRPNVRLAPFPGPGPYDDLDDALERVRQLLFIPPGVHDHDPVLRSFLSETLVATPQGLDWPHPQQSGIVWWEKDA
jgi:SAM-dependent methyltransferase